MVCSKSRPVVLMGASALIVACSGASKNTARSGGNAGGSAPGGTQTGGQPAGGSGGRGGVVASLPTRATACAADDGESRYDGRGGRCLCAGGIWFCNDACSRSTPPLPGTACDQGSACVYPADGVTCACVASTWICLARDACPSRVPMTGNACDGMTGVACDYPGPAHLACACLAAGAGSRWTCLSLSSCPATQPAYPATCDTGPTICSYGSTRCGCLRSGGPWLCV
jgi:hypothetical protein